jgi:NAD(P)-dependent dehydrogenase (short-subunit alcohol dehydrogenase family)
MQDANGAVLVTGGSGGIGQSLVKRLRRKGFRVAVADRIPPAEADFYAACDLSSTTDAEEVIARTQAAMGSIYGLVLCAGRYDASTLEDCSLEAFSAVLRINLEAPMAIVKAWLKLQASTEPRVVVLVGSAAGHIGSRDPAYSASKAGLLGLTRSLAINLTHRGVCVFSVSPGVVDTAMSQAQGDERRSSHVARTMLRRAAEPEEVSNVIEWLLESPTLYMSGADFNVSNGLVW